MKIPSMLIVLAVFSGAVLSADGGRFDGRLILEWVDDSPFIASMRLVEDFSFQQANGKIWTVPAQATIDGRSMPPLFRDLIGHPFESGFRKAAVVYDFAVQDMSQPWLDAQRMFHEASIVEGIQPLQAKQMYLLVNAKGSRWAERGVSSCFRSCHMASAELKWRPLVDDKEVIELVGWVRQSDPTLPEIEQRVEKALLHRGPHIFAHVR